ncbi:hypothetical protein [Stutzerimonas nitrititolerans]|uniref:hypothetical protein n=1 Tax=Stutzerimonas nitrititolerans TaxID=2482751 RepID=UPI0028AF6A1F|nr:hypothetical protein [Stutzerimonas nitrititolerans]
MLDLGSTDFNLSIPSVDASQLEVMSNSLFDEWDAYADKALALPDYSLFLQVEEGSIIGRGQIMAGAKALVIGLTAYGGLMSGVDIINKQLKSTNRFLAEQAQTIFACPGSRATVRKRGGAPASLQRLFSRVQRGELTPDEATVLAQSILSEDESEIPGFLEVLSKAFHECPNLPKQEHLPFDEVAEETSIELINKKTPKTPKPRPPDIPSLHYRVEVWRESKENRKQTKITVL